jgi:hypothetical protein
VNGHTALIRSFGTTGVLLVLALVLLAIVSAIMTFDRWPDSGSARTVERVAVDRSEVRRVETVEVEVRRPAPVVRGVFVVRPSAGTSAPGAGAGDAFLVADREPGDRSDGGGFGPPPPSVPFNPPGEGGGGGRVVPTCRNCAEPPPPEPPTLLQKAACDTRDALGQSGTPLDSACNPGRRGVVREIVTEATDLGVQVDLALGP